MELRWAELDALTRHERAALRDLLVRATAVAGRDHDPDDLERLVAAAPIDALPAAAMMHRVAGTVLRGLDGVDGVPAAVTERLAAMREHSARRHLLYAAALGQIARAFDASDLSWVAMKGPVIALRYPDVGDRTYNDLDMLVDRRDFPHAVRILEDLGYLHATHDWALAEQMLAGELSMSKQSVPVDLHWHLHYSHQDRRPIAIDPEAMIERSRSIAISGTRTSTFDEVDTLLTLAFHAARSDGHRLIWLKDIEREVAAEQLDFDELIRRCHQYRCARPVGLMLHRAHALLGAEVPDEVIRALAHTALRTADRVAGAIAAPVQLHERTTLTRVFTRSVRSSMFASVAAVPMRAVRRLRRVIAPPPENETDDPHEKDRYLQAVVASRSR
jgi:hypothetical protein